MPRPIYGLPGNIVAKWGAQPSVIEFPMKTTRFSLFTGAESLAFASRYFRRFGQSLRICSSCADRRAISSPVGGGACWAVRGVARNKQRMEEASAREAIFTF